MITFLTLTGLTWTLMVVVVISCVIIAGRNGE